MATSSVMDKMQLLVLKNQRPEGRPRHFSIASFATLEQESPARARQYTNLRDEYLQPQHVSRWEVFQGKKAASGTDALEQPRSAPNAQINAKGRKIATAHRILFSSPKGNVPVENANAMVENIKSQREYWQTTCKVFAEERALEKAAAMMNSSMKMPNGESPGAYSMHVANEGLDMHLDPENPEDKVRVKRMMFYCRTDMLLNVQMLHDVRLDNKWKTRYTTEFLKESGMRKSDIANRQGWVIPMKEMCERMCIDPNFFVSNPRVTLSEVRAHLIHLRLMTPGRHAPWLERERPDAVPNQSIRTYILKECDIRSIVYRAAAFAENVSNDRDNTRIHGEYFNNIYLGKRMFGPARRQKYVSTITGGMERRFEILDNQVNHQSFSHVDSDRNQDKCRNPQVHCNDETRVKVWNPETKKTDFIHANVVAGGPLFNSFIITQAPMDNTTIVFWRMILQVRPAYIFMLQSRKEEDKCAYYWPRAEGECGQIGEVTVRNIKVDDLSVPNFRNTYLEISAPNQERVLLTHVQGDLNNADNVATPLSLLGLARNCTKPVVVHDHLGISRAACLVAAEIAICSILRGPDYKYTVAESIQFLRSKRPYSVETPMQYLFIHRIVELFYMPLTGVIPDLHEHYMQWLNNRSTKLFKDDIDGSKLPGHRKLSPVCDPDLLRQVGRPPRSDLPRETASGMGQLPILIEQDAHVDFNLPNKYPHGMNYESYVPRCKDRRNGRME